MADIFISYKAEDRERVRPLVAALEAAGRSVWWDVHIEPGTSWRRTIQERLEQAPCVLVVWSILSVGDAGQFVHEEATRAQRRGVYLPVRIDPVEPPIGFGEIQALDLIGWKGNPADPRYQALAASIEAVLGGRSRPTIAGAGAPLRAHGTSRRALIGGGAAAALAATGGGVWWWRRRERPAANAIAVLPFENLSGDASQAYFSEGLSEELRDSLARIPGLQVAARISSDLFRDARDATAVAAKLGVAYVLDGSVRRSGELIRVSAQLVSGRTGFDRWSDTYDRSNGDALTIQSDIAGNVAQALEIALGAGGVAALQVGGTSNPAADDLYLKGRHLLDSVASRAALQAAQASFDAALALDPAFASAHAVRARTLVEMANSYASSGEAPALYQAALAAAQRAITLAPTLAQGHFELGYALAGMLRIGEAAAPYQRARQLGSGDAEILTGFAGFSARLGDRGGAAAAIQDALRRDPLNAHVHAVHGSTLLAARRYPDAIAAYRTTLSLNPLAPSLHWSIGDCLYLQGQYDAAAREYAQDSIDWARATGEAMVAWKRGDKAAADKALAALFADGGAQYQIAAVLAQRGEIAGALDALDQAWIKRDSGLDSLKTDPMLDPLRGEPRYRTLLAKIGF